MISCTHHYLYNNCIRLQPSQNRTIRHVPLPICRHLRIRRQITVRRERRRQIILHAVLREPHRADRRQIPHHAAGKVVQKDEVDARRRAPVGGEGRVGLEIVGLRVVRNRAVECVVAVGAKVVGRGVARRRLVRAGGLTATDAACCAATFRMGIMEAGARRRVGTRFTTVEADGEGAVEGEIHR